VALTNYGGALSELDEIDRLRQIAPELLKLSKESEEVRFQVSGLNLLARIYRLDAKPDEAVKVLREAISVCDSAGYLEPKLSNTVNLGNAYKDLRRNDDAERCYKLALESARDLGFPSIEAHALEVLAELRKSQAEFSQALDLTGQALSLLAVTKQSRRLSNVWRIRAQSFVRLSRHEDAARSWAEGALCSEFLREYDEAASRHQRSANLFRIAGRFSDAMHQIAEESDAQDTCLAPARCSRQLLSSRRILDRL